MANIQRSASAEWFGDLRGGNGKISAPSGVLQNDPYTHGTRFENDPGTNPEELIAAAHAACFSMAFAGAIAKRGFTPESIRTTATITMEKLEAGNTVTVSRLEVEGQVANMDEATFKEIAEDAGRNCPISRLLKPGLQRIEVVARLKNTAAA